MEQEKNLQNGFEQKAEKTVHNRKNGSMILDAVQKGFEEKSAKYSRSGERANAEILDCKEKIRLSQNKIKKAQEKIESGQNQLISLQNQNNFLESAKGQSANIDKILTALIFAGNRKIVFKKRKIADCKRKIRVAEMKIKRLENKVSELNAWCEKTRIKVQKNALEREKLRFIASLNVADPATALFLAKNFDAACGNIQKFCYRELDSADLKKIEGLHFSSRPGRNSDKILVRFDKVFSEKFESALG